MPRKVKSVDEDPARKFQHAQEQVVTSLEAARASLEDLVAAARHVGGAHDVAQAAVGALRGCIALVANIPQAREAAESEVHLDTSRTQRLANLMRGKKRRQTWDIGEDLFRDLEKLYKKSPEQARKAIESLEVALRKCAFQGFMLSNL